MKVVVGTTNPAKIEAVAAVVNKLFPSCKLIGVSVPSGVSAQPFDVHETMKGAQGRAKETLRQVEDADYGIGVEGGLELIGDRYFECGWICVMDRQGRVGWGSSARFELSAKLVNMLKEGRELADVIDEVSGQSDVRSKEGAMGVVTNGHLSRAEAYSHGVWFAFAPFISPRRYWE